jgi:hypothetical protein
MSSQRNVICNLVQIVHQNWNRVDQMRCSHFIFNTNESQI